MKTEQLKTAVRSTVEAIGNYGPAVKPIVGAQSPRALGDQPTLTLDALERAQSSLKFMRLRANRTGVESSSELEPTLTLASLERAQSSLRFASQLAPTA
ncbi:MAG: hypothetical protein PGN13_06055 [Patulibacter minatonensis]